ncbi:MAG: type II toxin-antitoxin system RelE/ParE family toxin [Gammaproteobacteria bacterium]|nr:type II toxin-antitoxin system RelE/ParE family toxin [Gammaproteobacteria bacterium]NNL51358.1 type II toxin-antitoxin system RelE/ParE family toxin [Woeseiaceae bacterium]
MTSRYRITPRAAADLDAIADYTIEKWGPERLETYLGALADRFEWLADNPLLGRDRSDIHKGYRSYPEGNHVVFYITQDDWIAIIGIPHKSMDIGAFFI